MAQPQHQKPAKPLHPADLPDPLGDSRDVPMASADDLLSEMVGDDVERLMSGEFEPIVPGHRAVERLQSQIGRFLDEVRQREQSARPAAPAAPAAPAPVARAAPSTPPARSTPPAPSNRSAPAARTTPPATRKTIVREDEMPALDDLVGPTREQLVGLHSGEYEPTDARGPAESRALLAPVNVAMDEPGYLRPLEWMSAPVAAMSARTRIAVSLLAVTSFLGGCAALGYVLMLRHGIM